jgi:hypothetical protein
MGTCPDAIKRLIDRFDQQSDQIRSPDYNETLIRIDFINPMMSALGWDIDNQQGFAEQYREVVHEDRVKVAGQTKAPDYPSASAARENSSLKPRSPPSREEPRRSRSLTLLDCDIRFVRTLFAGQLSATKGVGFVARAE